MAAGAIPNFDQYAWVAIGLFIAGLFMVFYYERISSRSKQREGQQPQRSPAGAPAGAGAPDRKQQKSP